MIIKTLMSGEVWYAFAGGVAPFFTCHFAGCRSLCLALANPCAATGEIRTEHTARCIRSLPTISVCANGFAVCYCLLFVDFSGHRVNISHGRMQLRLPAK